MQSKVSLFTSRTWGNKGKSEQYSIISQILNNLQRETEKIIWLDAYFCVSLGI